MGTDTSAGTTAVDPFALAGLNDVGAALFLLIRTQDITPEVFVCPSSGPLPPGPVGASVRPSGPGHVT